MSRRATLGRMIDQKLAYGEDTSKLRWIMDANHWTCGQDVIGQATDEQIDAFYTVWGADAVAL